MKRKFAFHPKDYAIGQTEKFYTDMAAKGWHLEHRNIYTSSFLKGLPMDMKYRVEVISPKAFSGFQLPEEQVTVYEDCGWEYVWGSKYIHVFRAPADSDTEEFYLDPAQQAETLKGLRKEIISNAVRIPFFLAVYNMLTGVFIDISAPGTAYRAWISLTWMMLGTAIFLLTVIADKVYSAVQINRLYKSMKNGSPIDHSPKNSSNILTISKYGLVLISIAMMLYSARCDKTYSMPVISDGAYITLNQIGENSSRNENSKIRKNEVSYRRTPFCQWWSTFEVLSEPNKWLDQDVYYLKNPKHAIDVARSLMNTDSITKDEKSFIEIPHSCFDRVYCYENLEIVVIKDKYVGMFSSIFTEESRENLLTVLNEIWI